MSRVTAIEKGYKVEVSSRRVFRDHWVLWVLTAHDYFGTQIKKKINLGITESFTWYLELVITAIYWTLTVGQEPGQTPSIHYLDWCVCERI